MLNLVPIAAALSITVWDKDLIGKEFLGQLSIPIADILRINGAAAYDDPKNEPIANPLHGRKSKETITGEIWCERPYPA